MNPLIDILKAGCSIVIVVILCLIFSLFRSENLQWYELIILEGIKFLPILILTRKLLGCLIIGQISSLIEALMESYIGSGSPLVLLLTVGALTSFIVGMGFYLTLKRKVFVFLLIGLFALSVFIDYWAINYGDLWMAIQTLIYWKI